MGGQAGIPAPVSLIPFPALPPPRPHPFFLLLLFPHHTLGFAGHTVSLAAIHLGPSKQRNNRVLVDYNLKYHEPIPIGINH